MNNEYDVFDVLWSEHCVEGDDGLIVALPAYVQVAYLSRELELARIPWHRKVILSVREYAADILIRLACKVMPAGYR